jgi:uncharacterized surface protein with fasciclin (FAS1) repeats
MQHAILTLGLAAVLGVSVIAVPAQAGNSSVETTVRSFGDLSMFYQAMVNTGVINELRESENYTIFAPTNAAFAQVTQQNYPCFYSIQCRAQVAAVLRNHIIVGSYSLPNLATRGMGIKTAGGRNVLIEEPYKDSYSVEGRKVLSASNVGNNMVYRIDGVIAEPQELSQFQTVTYAPAPGAVITEKTVVRKTYRSMDGFDGYPAGQLVVPQGAVDGNNSQSTTVIETYRTQEQ